MMLMRVLLPPLRSLTRVNCRAGGPLLGAALLRCLTPAWTLLPARTTTRLSRSEEAVAVYRTLVTFEHPRPGHLDGLARSLVLYARMLTATDRHEEALAAADESLSVPGARASGTQTALALYLRAECLAGMGRLDEALTAARESVETYRSAEPRRRDRTLGSPVYPLWMCAWVLGRLPRTDESVAVYLECVEFLRAMNPWQLFQLRVVRARVLMEVTGGLRALGRYDEALLTGVEAREGVAGQVPRFFPENVPPRAQLLTDLAWCYGATGDPRRACDTAEEAVAASRALAHRDPVAGETWLALALQCQAHHLAALDAPADEQRALRELADLCARLAVTHPDTYEPQLANVLDDLATLHWRADAPHESVEAARRSVDAYRRVEERQPGVFEPELSRTLANLSIRQLGTGEQQAAVESGTEALTITRRLAESDWDAYQPVIAARLRILARALHRSGDEAGALACYEEAETLLRELMDNGDPEPYEAALTATLTALARMLRTTAEARLNEGRTDDAVTALRSLLALTARTKQTDVHAICIDAFTRARAREPGAVRHSWQRVTTDPLPSFVYRIP
jgi:tetratricopeptide (TPR) repeat protein